MRIIHPIVCISIATAALSVGCTRDKTEITPAEQTAAAPTQVRDPIAPSDERAQLEAVNAEAARVAAAETDTAHAEAAHAEAARAGGVNAQVPAADRDRAGDGTQAGQLAAADNTAKNARDRDNNTLTPIDQKENETDLTITQKVRQGVIKRDDLSMTAKNVKIITADGVVTLRGPVDSANEKTAVGTIAKKVAGVKRVDNQLEIAANDDAE